MTAPLAPNPVQEANSEASSLTWQDVAALISGLIALLSFLYAMLHKKKKDKHEHEEEPDVEEENERKIKLVRSELDDLQKKCSDLNKLVEELDDRYRDLKKEVASLEDELHDLEKGSSKDVRRLEEKMDRIIDMILKFVSEQ